MVIGGNRSSGRGTLVGAHESSWVRGRGGRMAMGAEERDIVNKSAILSSFVWRNNPLCIVCFVEFSRF